MGKLAKSLIITLFCLLPVACSGGPPSDVVDEAVGMLVTSKQGAFIDTSTIQYEVTNSYTEQNGQDTIHVVDFDATATYKMDGGVFGFKKGDTGKFSGTVRVVKKGKKWYSL